MGGGNGQKAKMARERAQEKAKGAKGSQLESNKKAMNIQTFMCTTNEVKCREHAEAKHPKRMDKQKGKQKQEEEDTAADAGVFGAKLEKALESLQTVGDTIVGVGQVINQFLREIVPLVSAAINSQASATISRQSLGELTDSSFGNVVRTTANLGGYDDSFLPKPLSSEEADAVLKELGGHNNRKRMLQSDFKNWMTHIHYDACNFEIRFTGDDFEPDTGVKNGDFTLVMKGCATNHVDSAAVLGLQSIDGLFNSSKEVGVAVRRAQQVIRASGLERKYCVAGVTDGNLVQWFLVQRTTQDKFNYIQSPVLSFRESFCAVLISKPQHLYLCKLDPIDVNGKRLVFNKLLGYGATSKVYACQYNGQDVAAKVYKDGFTSDNEAAILEKLKDIKNIPTVVAKDAGTLILKQVGQELRSEAELEPEYATKLCDIVETLEAAHKLGYVHRDVRTRNMLKVKQEEQAGMMLIDWGFAAESNTECAFAGSYLTASDDILDQLQRQAMPPPKKKTKVMKKGSTSSALNSSPQKVKFEPKDDLISLVRSLYLYMMRGKASLNKMAGCEELQNFWKRQFAANKTFFSAQQMAASCSYADLKSWLDVWADYNPGPV